MSDWRHPATFRGRLTRRWTVAFGLLLAAANGAIYLSARSYLLHDLDAKVRTVAATELASSTDRAEIHMHELPAYALDEGEYADKFVQIFEADGRVRVASNSMRGRPPLVAPEVVAAAIAGQAPMIDASIDGRPGRAAVLGTQLGGRHYALLVGLYADQVEEHLASLEWLLAAVWVAGLGATAALGYGLASAALAPVVSITRRAARIAEGEFGQRLDSPNTHDEVGDMTRSLNHVLERLHGALEANRRFASDASHELRGPITAMAGEIDVTLRHPRNPEEYREALVLVRERLDALTALSEDLILLVRAHEGTRFIELREVSVQAQLRDAAMRLSPTARGRGVTIDAHAVPDLVAYADPRLLARVFDNVLSNAVHYNRDGGTVVISGTEEASAPGEWKSGLAVVTVTDTGSGIPGAEWERVFERFYRLDQSRARHTGGSGLGLAICREVLTLLGGGIRIVASSPAGTVVEIRIPGRIDRSHPQESLGAYPPPTLDGLPTGPSIH